MDYMELAKQFLQSFQQFKKRGHQKKIDEPMRGEIFVVRYLFRREASVLPGEISNEMNISSARIAALLNSLENKGLITRQIDKTDRRKILVDLTTAGKEAAKKYNQMAINHTVRMLQRLGEDDARALVRIMGRLAGLATKIPKD